MRKTVLEVAVTAMAVTAVTLAARRLARAAGVNPLAVSVQDRWHSVTVLREPEQLGPLPAPLDELGEAVQVRIRPAPGGRGTELAARLAEPVPGGVAALVDKARDEDPVRRLRRALREARSLAEVGEVILPDTPPSTKPTLTAAPLAYATRHGREEGRL
jgi:hypothetical protein